MIILIQCAISIINFLLLEPYDDDNFGRDVANDFFYEHPKPFTSEERKFILSALAITSIGRYYIFYGSTKKKRNKIIIMI